MPDNHPQTRVLVYGSLLDPARQRAVDGRELKLVPARLSGYERRRGRYFYIVPQKSAETAGAILTDLDARDLAALDRYKDVPELYTREIVEVRTEGGGRISCWCYLPTQKIVKTGDASK